MKQVAHIDAAVQVRKTPSRQTRHQTHVTKTAELLYVKQKSSFHHISISHFQCVKQT